MLTEEQDKIVNLSCSDLSSDLVVGVNAIAGSGKTSTAGAIIEAYNPKNAFYTAFNKAIVMDSAKRFGNKIDCRTIHSLAYRYVKPIIKFDSIEDFTVASIKEDLDYDRKLEVIDALDEFFRSSSIDIYEFMTGYTIRSPDEELCELVTKYAELMLSGSIPPTFNFLLKCLHLLLDNKEIQIDKDLLIFDEMQDSTGVMLEIFKLINADRKVILGDKYQNIYSFMHTVNAFDELDDSLVECKLTKSFRCDDNIANIVEDYGKHYLVEDFIYNGNELITKPVNPGIVYLSRTNAGLIERIYQLLCSNISFTLTKDINTIFNLPIAIINASSGRKVFDKKYKFLEKEYKKYLDERSKYPNFYIYLKELNDPVLASGVGILNFLKTKDMNIYDLKEQVKNITPNPNIVLSTVHTFKGLEMDTAYIENDLNSALENIQINTDISTTRKFITPEDKEILNLYYVALSRARTTVLNNITY